MRILVLTALIAILPVPASAMCFEPHFLGRAPTAPVNFYMSKPSVPFCLSSYSYTKEHTCSQWELDSYFDDVEDYAAALQRYYEQVVAFANDTARYAKEAGTFADEAYNYANCEIKDVNTQHE